MDQQDKKKVPKPKTDLCEEDENQEQAERIEPDGNPYLKLGLRNYYRLHTINQNTINNRLKLSDKNRKVTYGLEEQPYPDHPDRFVDYAQLLCDNGVTGRCYWEAKWSGFVHLSVSYGEIRRSGPDCWFGRNDHSWSLSCSEDRGFSVWHKDRKTSISSASSSVPHTIAVYVDCTAGVLSFYSVSSDKLIHLHTINAKFTEPLYPGFGFGSRFKAGSVGSSLFLC